MKRLIPLTILGLLLAACQTHQVNARNDDQALENVDASSFYFN